MKLLPNTLNAQDFLGSRNGTLNSEISERRSVSFLMGKKVVKTRLWYESGHEVLKDV